MTMVSRHPLSLKARIALAFVTLVIGTVALLSICSTYVTSRHVKKDIGRFLAETAFQMADKLDREMWSRAREVKILSQVPILKNRGDFNQAKVLLEELQASIPVFSWIGFTDSAGNVLVATGDILAGRSIAERPVFKKGQDGLFVGDVHDAVLLASLLPNPTGEAMKFVDIGTPVYSSNNIFLGVLASHLSWNWVSEVEQSYVKPLFETEKIELFVIASDNTIILGPKQYLGQKLDLPLLQEARKASSMWDVQQWPDGHWYVTGAAFGDGYREYPGLGWTTVTRQRIEDAYLPMEQTRYVILALGCFVAVVAAFVGVALASRITRPLQSIVRSAMDLRDGKPTNFSSSSGIPDIDILTDSLREMVASLSQTKAERDDMRQLAHRDTLTQLPNRAHFESFTQRFNAMALPPDRVLGVLFLDLDGFKAVNDTLGHDAGDFVLRSVAVRLAGCLRSADILARLGGDEFVALVTIARSEAVKEVQRIGDRIIASINNEIFINDQMVRVGCSIGVAFHGGDGKTLEEVVKRADAALYEAKKRGKNTVAFA